MNSTGSRPPGVPAPYPGAPVPASAPEPVEIDLRAMAAVLWRHKLAFVLCLVLIPGLTYLGSSRAQKSYESSALVQVQAQSADSTSLEFPSPLTDQTLAGVARLIQTTAVAGEAAKRIHPRPRARELLGDVIVESDIASGFLTIKAANGSPQRAADEANAMAEAIAVTRTRSGLQRINAAIAKLQRDLGNLKKSDGDARRQLSQQVQRLRALRAGQESGIQVIEPAVASSSPVSPHPRRDSALALIVALLFGLGLVFALDRLDRRIRSVNELEELTGAGLLGVIPAEAFSEDGGGSPVAEAFKTLRANLTYFNVDREVSSLMIVSPVQGEGKTTVALGLAASLASTGKRVILVETDLRHPKIPARLGVKDRYGLSDVLTGTRELEDVLIDVATGDSGFRVLPGGRRPPNPSELIASERMRSLLVSCESLADIVVIDTPAALVVSDAVPLLQRVSGVVFIARLDTTRRDAVRRLRAVIGQAGGTLLGVVATGQKPGGLYGYETYASYVGEDFSSPNGGAPETAAPAPAAPAAPAEQ